VIYISTPKAPKCVCRTCT